MAQGEGKKGVPITYWEHPNNGAGPAEQSEGSPNLSVASAISADF